MLVYDPSALASPIGFRAKNPSAAKIRRSSTNFFATLFRVPLFSLVYKVESTIGSGGGDF